MNLSLDQIAALEAVAREGSVTAAARALRRAPSAVSYNLRTLEEALSVTLLDRSGHRARLSEAGELVLAEGRLLLERARRVEQVAEELRAGWEPRLGLVVDGLLPQPPLMEALRRFLELGLPTKVQVGVEYLSGVEARFAEEEAELMLCLEFSGDLLLHAQPLAPVEVILLAHPGHPLHARSGPLDRGALREHVEVIVADSGGAGAARAHRLRFGSPHSLQLSDFHSKREALVSGVGFGWLPAHLAEAPLAAGALRELAFLEGSRYRFQPHLVSRRDPALGRGARRFEALLLEALGAQRPPPGC